jgi:hypothetical protein
MCVLKQLQNLSFFRFLIVYRAAKPVSNFPASALLLWSVTENKKVLKMLIFAEKYRIFLSS